MTDHAVSWLIVFSLSHYRLLDITFLFSLDLDSELRFSDWFPHHYSQGTLTLPYILQDHHVLRSRSLTLLRQAEMINSLPVSILLTWLIYQLLGSAISQNHSFPKSLRTLSNVPSGSLKFSQVLWTSIWIRTGPGQSGRSGAFIQFIQMWT